MTIETIGDHVARATGRLNAAGIDGPRREARLLMAHTFGKSVEWLVAHDDELIETPTHFENAVRRREAREPLSHILGEREFWSLRFQVNASVLDPRPDSETLVAAVLAQYPEPDTVLKIADLGTGSGCLLLSILNERPGAQGVGVDISESALSIARENAQRFGLAARANFNQSDWDSRLDGTFDIVVSNPPYIPTAAIDDLAPEVARFEPRGALDGGVDGLDAYRHIAAVLPQILKPNGFVALEIGQGQDASVTRILRDSGIRIVGLEKDLAGIPRCVLGRL
ncbi:MAG: peptide chain release factor N(5)-glutamine methyltransferase [Pseudomonadota bacterium]|nr:peptide chain release factor N(5)-glutamine methyltransferase [Pseudomonadota bacterium]